MLDASAVLALVHDEPGADVVMAALPGSALPLAVRSEPPEVLTADRVWDDLDLPIRVRLVR